MLSRLRIRLCLFIFMITQTLFVYAGTEQNKISLDVENANLVDVIRVVAKSIPIDVMTSQTVRGASTLHLQAADPVILLNLLLTMNGLARQRYGNIWYIAPQDEMIQRAASEAKWRETSETAMPLLTRVWQIRYAKAQDVARLLQEGAMPVLSSRAQLRVDPRTNVIFAREVADRLLELDRIVRRVDVPVRQVLIEARLASVDHDAESELGLNFAVKSASVTENGAPSERNPVPLPGRYSLAVIKLADDSILDVKLAALERAGRAELISSPTLFTSNQQTASIEAGEEVPYQEVSESGGTAVTFKKAVLGLRVTPQLLPGGQVLLELKINQDRPSSRMVQGVPAISTRQIVTSVLVRSGQTLVLGGIYETNHENGVERIPFLSALPVVGVLFQIKTQRDNKRELLIFVTPKMIAQSI